MNKTLWSCLLSAACVAATTVWIPAQSAPMGGLRAPAQGPGQNERLQRRLGEVIALLEGDDLTAEEKAKARKTLQDIADQLRNTRTTTPRTALAPVDSGGVDVRPGAGLDVRRFRASTGEEGVIVEEGGEAPKMRRARAVEGQRGVYQYEGAEPGTPPMGPKPSKAGKADAKRYVEAQPPTAPMAPEAPRARRAYVEYEEAERAHEGAARGRADAAKVYTEREAQGMNGYAEKLRTSAARSREDAARARAEAAELRAHAEGLRGQLGVGAEGEPIRSRSSLRGRAAEPEGEAEIRAMIDEMRKEMREIRSLMQKIRQQAHDEEDEDEAPHAESYSTQLPGLPPVQLPSRPLSLPPGQPPSGLSGRLPGELPTQPPVPPSVSVPGTPFVGSYGGGTGFARQ